MRKALLRYACTGLAVSAVAGGCAGLEAKRVPLQERIAGADHKQKGFRYYLSRPYLVVSDRLDVTQTDLPARVIVVDPVDLPPHAAPPLDSNAEPAILETYDEQGYKTYFDLSGKPLGRLTFTKGTKPLRMDAIGQYLPKLSPMEQRNADEQRIADEAAKKELEEKEKKKKDDAKKEEKKEEEKKKEPGKLPEGPAKEPKKETTEIKEKQPPALLPKPAPVVKPGDPGCEEKPPPQPILDIVYLPDFEEQMAIKHKGIMAKDTIKLRFHDGWQLKSVEETVDETVVPIRILETVRNALTAAQAIATKKLQIAQAAADRAAQRIADEANRDKELRSIQVRVVIRRTQYIEPGIYRLQKNSERDGKHAVGTGLLSDLGIPVVDEVQVLVQPKK